MNKEQIKNKIKNFIAEIPELEENLFYENLQFGVPKNVPPLNANTLANYIDHTILKPEATKDEIINLCNEAARFRFASVCVNSTHIPLAYDILKDTTVKVCTVVGFPLGACLTDIKVAETKLSIELGAKEIDMVMNIGLLKSKQYAEFYKDLNSVIKNGKMYGAVTKVIIETALLNEDEKILSCLFCLAAGADFIKTSTGFSKSGADAEDIQLLSYIASDKMKVKASGGIKSREAAELMILSGADRIGTSSGVSIVKE